MRLVVDALGPIRRVDVTLRPLTLLVGPSGSGKSWAAHCLYGLASQLSWDAAALLGNVVPPPAGLGRGPSAGLDGGPGAHAVGHAGLAARVERATREVLAALEDTAPDVELPFSFTRAELSARLEGPLTFGLDAAAIAELLRVPAARTAGASASLEVDASELAHGCADVASLRVRAGTRSVFADFHQHGGRGRLSGRMLLGSAPTSSAWPETIAGVLRAFALWSWGTVLLLPPERVALAALYASLTPEQEALLPVATARFAATLRAAEALGSDESPAIPPELRASVGARLAGGHVGFSHAPHAAPVTFSPRDGLQVPIHAAPVAARAALGLDVYLRHFASPGDLIVIEEPELGLDADAQRAAAELLVDLAVAGVRVVATTHADALVARARELAGDRIPEADVIVHRVADGGSTPIAW